MNPIFIILFIVCLPCLLPCMPCIISSFLAYWLSGAGQTKPKTETFNNQTGRLCTTCGDKNMNQCTSCFNCGYCVDKFGNGKCIGTDGQNGREGLNNEKCDRMYTGDDWERMIENNQSYKFSYGPMQANRVIGINPC